MKPISNKATERHEQVAAEDVFRNCNRKGCSHPPTQLILNWSCIHDCYESFLLLCDVDANDWSELYWEDQPGWTGATNRWTFHALTPSIIEAFERHWGNPQESESEFLRKHIEPLIQHPWFRPSQAKQPAMKDG